MGNINADGIWTPDEDDTLEPDVWSAMMAESISQGLGERMKLQEKRISLRATTPVPFKVDSATAAYVQIPLTIAENTGVRDPNPDFSPGNHANGILIEGNYAKIVTPGFYTITGQATFHPGLGADAVATHSWDFFGQINGQTLGLPDYGVTSTQSWSGARIQDTRFLAANDMIELRCGVGTDHTGAFWVQDAMLSIAIHYAIPEA